tara:strand:- start:6832 stop:7524 length:693 start_codon:yes stop_codon:yes gene_type:complete
MKNEDTIRNYIKESNSRYKKQKKHFVTKNNIQVHIKDPLVNELDLDSVFNRVESLIPSHLFYNLDLIYIGQFDEFLEREMNAFYKNGAIYITNEQTDENDMIDDIIHEISHSVEEIANEEIYGDGDLELEFLGKRKRLYNSLKSENFDVSEYNFLNPDYSIDFDRFLYQQIGYPTLLNLTMGLFLSPYSITSIREYFATGFEEYYLKDRKYLKKICPFLFRKIEILNNLQ